MQTYVCIKNVPDSAAKITLVDQTTYDESVKFVMNPYDENAVEEALKLKNDHGGEVIVVCIGKESAQSTLRSALAMGADRGILVKTDESLDSLTTAKALYKTIKDDGNYDLILTGKQSIDSEGMQTQFRLAKAFEIPATSGICSLNIDGSKAVVEREIEGGAREVLELTMPCLVSADKSLNVPRYPKLPNIMKAKKKPLKQLDLDSLSLESSSAKVELIEYQLPPEKAEGQVIEGEPAELAQKLVQFLREEAKVI